MGNLAFVWESQTLNKSNDESDVAHLESSGKQGCLGQGPVCIRWPRNWRISWEMKFGLRVRYLLSGMVRLTISCQETSAANLVVEWNGHASGICCCQAASGISGIQVWCEEWLSQGRGSGRRYLDGYGSKCQYAGRLAVTMEVYGMAGSCFMMSLMQLTLVGFEW